MFTSEIFVRVIHHYDSLTGYLLLLINYLPWYSFCKIYQFSEVWQLTANNKLILTVLRCRKGVVKQTNPVLSASILVLYLTQFCVTNLRQTLFKSCKRKYKWWYKTLNARTLRCSSYSFGVLFPRIQKIAICATYTFRHQKPILGQQYRTESMRIYKK